MARMTTAEALVEALIRHGLNTIYGVPGMHNDPLFDALFSAQNIALRDKIRSHETLLRGPLSSPEAQQAVLERIEGLVQERAELLKKTPALLKQFYDLGLLEEEQLLAWHGKAGSGDMAKAMRKETQQLIDWLKTTEDDQDEEEEQEEQGEDDEEDA